MENQNLGPSLREYVEALFTSHKESHKEHEQAHGREHDFSQKAIDIAASLAKENKADANEWRETMNDRERNFATKMELGSIGDRVNKLEDAEIARMTEEKLTSERAAEARRQEDRDRARQQWVIATVIGVIVFLATQVSRLVFPT